MKIRLLSALSALLCLALLASCSGIIASGIAVEKNFPNTGFDAVKVSSAFECEITQGKDYSVLVQVDQSAAEYVEVVQTGATLSVGFRPMTFFAGSLVRTRVIITMPALSVLSLGGASSGTVSGFTAASGDLAITLDGASSLNWTGGSVERLVATVNGASACHLYSLAAAAATVSVNGASELDGQRGTVTAGTLALTASGASTVLLDVSGTVTGSVSGASTFRYGLSPTLTGLSVSDASSSGPR